MRTPRDYQLTCIEAVRNAFRERKKGVVAELFTGAGKAFILSRIAEMVREKQGRVLCLVNRDNLCEQLFTSLVEQGLHPAMERGADKATPMSELVVGSVQTMQGDRLKKWNADHWKMVITDECFPSGTMIETEHGPRNIRDIPPGDLVVSFNHKTGKTELKRVICARVRMAMGILEIRLKNKTIIRCTPNHPFWNGNEYIPAFKLTSGSEVFTISTYGKQSHIHNPTSDLSSVQDAHNLLQRKQNKRKAFSNSGSTPKGASVLQPRMSKTRKGSRQSKMGNGEQSDEIESLAGETIGHTARAGMGSSVSRRKRAAASGASVVVGIYAGMEDGTCSEDKQRERDGIPDALQNRHRKSGLENSGGNRRKISQSSGTPSTGQEERSFLDSTRVESVTFQECDRDKRTGEVSGCCLVHNLEVQDNHNYFANGVLVHNCHFAAAKTFKHVLTYFRNAFHLGITATVERHDKEGLWDGYVDKVFSMPLSDGVDHGWLVPLVCKELPVPITISDAENAKKVFTEKDEEGLFARDSYLPRLFAAAAAEAQGRKALMFWPGCAASEAAAAAFAESGIESMHVDGYMAKSRIAEILAWFKTPGFKTLHNADLLSYGYDNPSIDCVGIMRVSRSIPMLLQRIGRGTRTYEANVDSYPTKELRREAIRNSPKPSCLVLDLMLQLGNAESSFASSGNLITGSREEAEYVRKHRKAGAPIDLEEMKELVKVKRSDDQKALDRLANDAANAAARRGAVSGPYYQHILDKFKNGKSPATVNQMRYLGKLGYAGPKDITSQQAHLIIDLFVSAKKGLQLA